MTVTVYRIPRTGVVIVSIASATTMGTACTGGSVGNHHPTSGHHETMWCSNVEASPEEFPDVPEEVLVCAVHRVACDIVVDRMRRWGRMAHLDAVGDCRLAAPPRTPEPLPKPGGH
jgi:hypothetical protein